MSLYFTVQITGGTSTGPYNIYYNTVSNGTIATMYPSGSLATGKTLSQLTTGFVVSVPNSANQIIIYNNSLCKLGQTIQIPQQQVDYPKLCFQIYIEKEITQFILEYQNVDYNGKPQYTNGAITVQWNSSQNYWEMIGFPSFPGTYVSSTNSDIPDTSWQLIGSPVVSQIIVYQNQCPDFFAKPGNGLSLIGDNPTCVGDTDGSIQASLINAGPIVYSLDGIIYSNYTGVFTNLPEGFYTVYAKDNNNVVVSDTITLVADPVTTITIPYTKVLQTLSSVGNMNYYNLSINYNTSLIPVGETVYFDYKFIYNLIYDQPGTVLFDTSNSTLLLNGINQIINNTSTTPFLVSGPLPCNPSSYFKLTSNDEFVVNSLSLVNGDTLQVNVVYGVDTQTNGANIAGCITKGYVNINAGFENVSVSCPCCEFTNNQINEIGTPQIYIF